MHLLAHAVLADCSLEHANGLSIAGSLMADYLAKPTMQDWPPALCQAIQQHIDIDRFTDTHPSFLAARSLIQRHQPPRFTAGILVDLFWGHLLAAQWERFGETCCGLSLPPFLHRMSLAIRASSPWHTASFRRASDWLADPDWLGQFAFHAGLENALAGLSRRLSGAIRLQDTIGIFDATETELLCLFKDFWPQVVDYSKQWRNKKAP